MQHRRFPARVGVIRFVLLLLAVLVVGCDEREQKAAKAKEIKEKLTKLDAERQRESTAFMEGADQKVRSSVNRWIAVKDGMLVLQGSRAEGDWRNHDTIYGIPISVPWFARCDDLRGLSLVVGAWVDVGTDHQGRVDTEPMFHLFISRAAFTQEQCRILVGYVGGRMREITSVR